MYEIPQYCLRAYALFFTKYGSKEMFQQSELDWIVSQSMKKKIFSILLKAGWIKKQNRNNYVCIQPEQVMKQLVQFKVPYIIKQAQKKYAFTGMSAVEIWSDYSYVQRSIEKSPYFIKILDKDLTYWKSFLSKNEVPCYVNNGSTIGEYVILIPVKKILFEKNNDLFVESLKNTIKLAKQNQ